jgi:rhodanese-related sulfurtransferase
MSKSDDHRSIERWRPERLRTERANREDLVVLDVRTADARALHPYEIPGARWMPLAAVVQQAESLPREAPIVAYCT